MKLLLLAPFPYGSASGQGGATVCLNALKALALSHDVAILCFNTSTPGDNAALLEMGNYARTVHSVPLKINKWIVAKAKLRSIFGKTPEHAIYFESDQFRTTLASTIKSIAPDIVMTQFPQMAQYLGNCVGVKTVHDVQDAFSVSWYRRARTSAKGFAAWYAFKQWRNWLVYETTHYGKATQCWTLSEQDRYGLTVFNPQLNVVCMGLPLTDKLPEASTASGTKVGFIASFGHPPNREALRFLIQEIAPRVQTRMPQVEFSIAGREPPHSLVRTAPANTQFVGYVDSLQDFYDSCGVIVAPLLSGGGVKIKVAEALCFGKAVVTTPVGAEGIAIKSGVHAYVEADADRFADAICTLMASENERTRMSAAAADLAGSIFSAESWQRRATYQLAQLLGGTTPTPAHDR
jgi:polysaccharide biosynthesis protein PslH